MQGVVEGSLAEFAPDSSGDGGDDGFSEETLKRLAAQWWQGDEDPRVERTLASAGWEIGQDESYDDEPGVFVVQAADVIGNSYISWPAHELKGVSEDTVAESKTMEVVVIGPNRRLEKRRIRIDPTTRDPVDAIIRYYARLGREVFGIEGRPVDRAKAVAEDMS